MKVFEINKMYLMNWVGDADLKTKYKVIKRTAKTITVQHRDEIKNCRVSVSYDGTEETIFPTGKYSMAPVLRASKQI